MGRKTRSQTLASQTCIEDFTDQGLLEHPDQEHCLFTDQDIKSLKSRRVFPDGVVFRPFDPTVKSDFASKTWVCFPELPFTLGFNYPFSALITEFFEVTGLSYF
jgi:hypothetical protein